MCCKPDYVCPPVEGRITLNFTSNAPLQEVLEILERNDFYFHNLNGFKYQAKDTSEESWTTGQMESQSYVYSARLLDLPDTNLRILMVDFKNIRTQNLEGWNAFLSLHNVTEFTGNIGDYPKQAWVNVPEGEEDKWIKVFEKEPIVTSAHITLSPCTIY